MPSHEEAELIDRLRDLLASVVVDDALLPSEPALAAALGASRPALREALMRLEAEGLLSRRRGSGTTINRLGHSIRARFDQQVEFVDLIASSGRTPSLDVLVTGTVRLDRDEAQLLGRDEGAPAHRTVKRWSADGAPVMVAVDVVPFGSDEDEPAFDPYESLFTTVTNLTGHRVEWEIARPGAIIATDEVAGWLGAAGLALITLDLLGVSRTGAPLYHAIEYHVPGAVDFGFVRTVR